ncbi:MAG TPA: cupin domain-containing protein [Longimicrobium sp.]|nr:cupin domain-containing protein [Longimicrobium sp.]
MSPVTFEPLAVHADARGSVFEPLGPDALPDQRNVHVVVTEPGGVRGNHLHRHGTETLVIHGPALFRCREDGEIVDVEVPPGAVYRFTIPPGVAHALKNTGDAPAVAVSFVPLPHDRAAPDVVPVVLL